MPTLENYNADEVEADKGFEDLPDGQYAVQVDSAEMKPHGQGEALVLQLTIVDGDYTGRKYWARFTWENPNQQAVEIGRSQFKSAHLAMGVDAPKNTDELLGKQALVTLKRKGDFQNAVRWEPIANRATQTPKGDNSKRPWGKQ